MAKYIWQWMMVVLAVASTTTAIKCYLCTDCENTSATYGTCPPQNDRCITTTVGGKQMKSCAAQSMCDAANQAKDMLNSFKGILGDHATAEMNAEMKAATGGEEPMMECCATDYCNAASNKMMNSALLFLLPLALYILHC